MGAGPWEEGLWAAQNTPPTSLNHKESPLGAYLAPQKTRAASITATRDFMASLYLRHPLPPTARPALQLPAAAPLQAPGEAEKGE